jgi:hypothetical protein
VDILRQSLTQIAQKWLLVRRDMNRRKAYLSVAVRLLCAPVPWAWSSGVSPFCKFGEPKSIVDPEARYDIGRAYQAADLVVVGETADRQPNGNILFHVQGIIKGAGPSTIQLVGPHCQGTACTGLSLTPHISYLMLLRHISPGLFHKVDGDGNDACPNIFLVKQDEVILSTGAIKLKQIREFFESHPKSIPLK